MLGLVEPFVHLEWRRVRELVEPLQRANETIAELRAQNESLKEQARLEVGRRDKLEEELQKCEQTEAENQALKEAVARLRGSAEDAGRLVKSSRRLQRQQADEVLALRAENERLLKVSEPVASLEAEIESLRALVCDKDAAILRQVRTMETLKELIQRLRQVHPDVNRCIEEFFQAPASEEDESDPKVGAAEHRRRLCARPPKTGAVRASARSSASQLRRASAASARSAERPSQPASRGSTRDAAGAAKASSPDRGGPALSSKQLDAIASLYVQLGSRVTVDVQGTAELGTVKYVGLAQSGDQDRVFVGVRLHQPQGNSDGTFRGVRYFTAPRNRGLFVRAHKVLGVFNPKKNCHTSLSECIQAYLKMHQ